MRILFVTTSYPSSTNPTAGIFVHLLAKSLSQRGHQIRVITPGDKEKCGIAFFEGIEVERVWYAPRCLRILAQSPGGIPAILRAKPYLLFVLPFLLLFMGMRVAKSRAHYDVIHGHWCVTSFIVKISSFMKKNTPSIITLRGADVKVFSKKAIRTAFRKSRLLDQSFFTTVSDSLSQEFCTFFEKDRRNLPISVKTVPNGIEKEFFEIDACDASGATKLLYIGSIIPRKRVDMLVNACKLALEHGCSLHLTIVGEGPEREKIVNFIETYNLHHRVHVVPYVAHSCIPALLQEAHCFVLCSASEGRPNVVIEAMAAGRAVLATDLPCLRELIGDFDCAYIAPPEDTYALANIIMKACHDRERLRHMGENARKRILELGLDWDDTAERYEQIYYSIVS